MKTFINVEQMKLATLQAGQFVETGGYYTKGDAGAARYLIKAAQAFDGYGDHVLANGTVAVLQVDGEVNIKHFGAVGDAATDDTLAIQAAIDTLDSIFFPKATYAVHAIIFRKRGAYYSGNPTFYGLASAPAAAIVEIVERNITFTSLNVQQYYNSNYTSALKWHSLTQANPSQYCKIHELKIEGAIIGILFGRLHPEAVVDAPQSENSIINFHTRGTQIPIYINQPNGYLMISNSVINCIRSEWESINPGIYSYADSRAIESYQGVIHLSNCELLKTDTREGYGVEMFGGGLLLDNVSGELTPTNFYISSSLGRKSKIYISNSYLYFLNTLDEFIFIEPAALGEISVSNSKVERTTAGINANKPFINHGGNSEFSIKLSNITLENFISRAEFTGFNGALTNSFNTEITNLLSLDGSTTRINNKIPSNDRGDNILLSKNVDTATDTTDGWYLNGFYGATTMTVVADAAATSAKEKQLSNAIEFAAAGEATLSTIDKTSLTTIKETGFPISQGTLLLVSARLKATVSGSYKRFGAAFYDVTGATLSYAHLSNSADEIDTTWRYFEGVVEAPAGAKYACLNVSAGTSTILITDAMLKILN